MAARVFHIPLIQAEARLALSAIASSRPAEVLAAHPGMRVHGDPFALCRDPELDLIVIPTPNESHAPLAEAALRAGKHVVVDKPFTLDAAEAQRLVGLAAEAGKRLTVFQNRRWDGDFLTLQAVLRSGRVGRPVQLDSNFNRFRPAVQDRWRERDIPGGGIWYDLGPHLVDQAVLLFGEPQAVRPDLAVLRDGGIAPDFAQVTLVYDRLRVNLAASMLAAAPGPRFVLHGTAGSFVIHGLDPQEDALKAGTPAGSPGWGGGAPDGEFFAAEGTVRVPRLAGDYPAFYANVAAAIAGEARPEVSPAQMLAVMRVLDSGRRSAPAA
ncbi:MAG: hypothetical protein B7Z81_05280 [Acidocella sp. 20-61-6]|nr:MAG: hypothetical protein B7Z81_05280 [Acidocella sp. 20-61-6]